MVFERCLQFVHYMANAGRRLSPLQYFLAQPQTCYSDGEHGQVMPFDHMHD